MRKNKQKIKFILNDLNNGYSRYEYHENQIFRIRNWSLMFFLAYFVFVYTVQPKNVFPILPYGIVIFLFMYLEARERMWMRYISQEAITISRMLMLENKEVFHKEVSKYVFRELKILDEMNNYYSLVLKRIKNMFKIGMIVWYSILLVVSFLETLFLHKIIL